jgi:hypothetical protein
MNIPWNLKSNIFSVIDFINAPALLYFLQKNVTKRARIDKLSISPIWKEHKKYLQKYSATGLIFEFGAGKSLAQNLFLSDVVDEQLVVDLNPMIDIELVETSREQLSKMLQLKSDSKIVNREDLTQFGIKYKAPWDAVKSGLENQTLDACISTNTLEHIPEASIVDIFTELRRTLKDTGIVSAKIDYSDHYAHTDRSISLLNYLKYDTKSWQKYNHACHYQNRLRHYDYIRIFEELGFSVIEQKLSFDEQNIPQEVENLFKDKNESWKATSAHIILKKL